MKLWSLSLAVVAVVALVFAGFVAGQKQTRKQMQTQTVPVAKPVPSARPSQLLPSHSCYKGETAEKEIAKWEAKGCRVIEMLGGYSIITSDTFYASKDEWVVCYSSGPAQGQEPSNFVVLLYKPNGELVEVLANTIGEITSATHVHHSGEFYITVNTTQPFEVICVEDR